MKIFYLLGTMWKRDEPLRPMMIVCALVLIVLFNILTAAFAWFAVGELSKGRHIRKLIGIEHANPQ